MSTIIRTRSPFMIRTPQEISGLLNYFEIVITIKSGLSGSTNICDDLYAQFTLRKKPIGNENSVSFDISQIVNDHIQQKFNGSYLAHATKASVWVVVSTSARQSNGSIIGTATTNTYLAQEGFNKFKEGLNYTVEPNAMISSTYMQYDKNKTATIPVNNERVTQVQWRLGSSVVQTTTCTDSGNQNQKIKYISKGAGLGDVDNILITHSGGTDTITLESVEECKYPVHKITFLNRWGALQDLYFFKKSVETLESRNETFNASIFKARVVTLQENEEGEGDCTETVSFNTYNINEHQKKTFNANATESILLNSGFVNELMNPYFEELMVSEYIWMTDADDVIYPVNIKDSSFTYRTSVNDRLINYTMNFERAFHLVNDIR